MILGERSGSVVECLTPDRVAAGSSLTGVTALCQARHINPSLVLVQPRKTRPCITERLLMGCKESNQTNKTSDTLIFYAHNPKLNVPDELPLHSLSLYQLRKHLY